MEDDNGKLCKEIESGIYETQIASWSPYEQLTVTTDAAGLHGETWTTSTFHVMNTVLYLALAAAAIIILGLLVLSIYLVIFLLKRLRHNQTVEQID